MSEPIVIGSPLVSIHLYGELAEKYGDCHKMAIRTPSEAVAALDANYPGFINDFKQCEHYGMLVDGDWRNDDMVTWPISREVHFYPIIEGRAFLGAIAVSALFPALSATAANIIGGLLVSALLFGVSLLLAPKQKSKDSAKDENYAFSGAENTTEQGAPVPLIYGRVHAGSVVVSAGLELDTEYTTAQVGALMMMSGGGGGSLARMFTVAPDLEEPVGGWPPIIDTPQGKMPLGWDFSERQTMARGQASVSVAIYTSPREADGQMFAWSEISGFYAFKTSADKGVEV